MITVPQIDSVSLRRYRYFASSDLDDARERIANVFQPSQLVPSSSQAGYAAFMNYVRLANLSFGSLGYGAEMGVEAGEIEDYYLLLACLGGYASVSVGGRRMVIHQSQGVIVSPNTPFGGTFSEDCEQFFVRIDRQAILAYSGLDTIDIDPLVDLRRTELAPWLQQVALLTSSPDMVRLAQREQRVAVELERLLTTLLLSGQPHNSHERTGPLMVLPRTVRRAEAFIAEHACEPLTLADIAEAAGVPMRTLLHSFKQFRNISPMQLVREARMEKARQMLTCAGDGERVSDIALSCGFVNLGRFANAYRMRFGETPSDTLRGSKRRAA